VSVTDALPDDVSTVRKRGRVSTVRSSVNGRQTCPRILAASADEINSTIVASFILYIVQLFL